MVTKKTNLCIALDISTGLFYWRWPERCGGGGVDQLMVAEHTDL